MWRKRTRGWRRATTSGRSCWKSSRLPGALGPEHCERGVGADDRDIFDDGLRGEEAVERIAVDQIEAPCPVCVGSGHFQLGAVVSAQSRAEICNELGRARQLSQIVLETDLVCGNRADE